MLLRSGGLPALWLGVIGWLMRLLVGHLEKMGAGITDERLEALVAEGLPKQD